jgi:hypothetical protein
MKKCIAIIVFSFLHFLSFGQNTDIKIMVDSLQFLKSDTLDCRADLYWRIISKGDKAIPFLIEKLDDTTATNVSYKCKLTKLNVAEVAQQALTTIADFPVFLITHEQFCLITNGCWSFYDYFYNDGNKIIYKKMVKDWYAINKTKFKAEKISKSLRLDCSFKKYKIITYYRWTK